ncbi:MAG: Coenzyme F420 hydrogenase/dehydrogenase, beta subunit C-terminal domain [Lachnospiraceae bacterium]|nr:Coenzyme F420 hydrogenase/dehydrogenase, beta subunit C-terminal domain [Lachnospiraceae bacterium]
MNQNRNHNYENTDGFETEAYIIRYGSEEIVRNSTSGGAFSAVACHLLCLEAIVYATGYDESMSVICKRVTSAVDLAEMRGSKFVQSKLSDAFKKVKEDLDDNNIVLFVGTPCQVVGLKNFLQKSYENLFCMDFVCRGVPSPGLWKKYIDSMEKRFNSRINKAAFKNKTYGYHASTMKIFFDSGVEYIGSGRIDPFLKAFVNELSSRPSCSKCRFKQVKHKSDLTVFDCYRFKEVTGEKDDDKGYTSLLVHSEKGKRLLSEIKDTLSYLRKVDIDVLIENNGIMVENSAKPSLKRSDFYRRVMTGSIDEAINYVLPIKRLDYIIERLKGVLVRTGILKIVRKVKKDRIEISRK